jgi:hypothetical protein
MTSDYAVDSWHLTTVSLLDNVFSSPHQACLARLNSSTHWYLPPGPERSIRKWPITQMGTESVIDTVPFCFAGLCGKQFLIAAYLKEGLQRWSDISTGGLLAYGVFLRLCCRWKQRQRSYELSAAIFLGPAWTKLTVITYSKWRRDEL